jgi:hypothetical protein
MKDKQGGRERKKKKGGRLDTERQRYELKKVYPTQGRGGRDPWFLLKGELR